jgi:hypothetical protein
LECGGALLHRFGFSVLSVFGKMMEKTKKKRGHYSLIPTCREDEVRSAGWSVQAVQAAQRIPGKGRQVLA